MPLDDPAFTVRRKFLERFTQCVRNCGYSTLRLFFGMNDVVFTVPRRMA